MHGSLPPHQASGVRIRAVRPLGYGKLATENPTWPQLFAKKLDDLDKETREGIAGLVGRLRCLHLLPIFPAYFRGRIVEADAAVTPWDRLSFRLAVAHLLSWESWGRRAAAEHARRTAILRRFREEHLTDGASTAIATLRRFERERSEYLSTLGLGASEYRVMRRQIRNWPDLRERWLKSGSDDPEALMQIAQKEQTRLRGRFGDHAVFDWLAAADNQHVWRSSTDTVSLLATLNAMEALVARSRETALMTFPDPIAHPRAVQWSAPGDSNLRPYRIGLDEQGDCWAQLRLLARREEDNMLEDDERTLKLGTSEQFRSPVFSMRDKKAAVTFQAAGIDTVSGIIGSADLLFDRPHMERRLVQALAAGNVGPVWLKLSLDLDVMPREGWTKEAAWFTNHFRAASGKATGHEARVFPGARVLSVDLGIRSFAACSVFSLVDVQPGEAKFAIPMVVGEQKYWAVHERSFHLTLLDERADRGGDLWRREQDERLRRLRRALSRYRRIVQLGPLDAGDRVDALRDLEAAHAEGDPFPFEAELLTELVLQAGAQGAVWATTVAATLIKFKAGLGSIIKTWRRKGRARSVLADRHSGPSMWAIQHLSDIRRLLLSWSLMGRRSGDVRRQDRAARGVFASGLLTHIDAVKENRLKAGGDLIVQAARGYLRDKAGRWKHAHPACDVVLFEDPTRYRMLTDRPRRENSQLMLWAHRAMPAEVAMQGELYGLAVADTAAAFSSRYHASSMAPGIRCRSLTKADLIDPFMRERLAEDNLVPETLRPGDLVPSNGGEIFVCQRAGGGLWRIGADINAAQNLQRRFWTRHAEAFRIPCRVGAIAGQPIYVPRNFGQRLLGAMGGLGILEPTGADSGACRWRPMKRPELRKLGLAAGDVDEVEASPGTDAEELQGMAEQAAELSGKFEVLFRDPSGVVLPKDRWYPRNIFWGFVKAGLVSKLRPVVGVLAESA